MTIPQDAGYCVHCGQSVQDGHPNCARTHIEYEPPRFCAVCARRMVVQITPAGWTARCSRHGESSSA